MTTIKEIAKQTGVSVATVSHVVNKTRYVSPELKKKVEDAINALDEIPNFVIKGQKKIDQTTKLIIVYVSNFANPFQRMVLEQLQNSFGAGAILFPVGFNNLEQKSDEIYQLINEKIDGQIVLYEDKTIPKSKIKFKKFPTVFIGNEQIVTDEYSTIVSETKKGGYLATNHLIKNGHSKISLIHFSNIPREDLVSGYEQALMENELKVNEDYISVEISSPEELRSYLQKLLHHKELPTAMIVGGETLLYVIDFLEGQDIKIPEDLSIIVTDNEGWHEYFTPSLSSIEHDIKGISEKAMTFIKEEGSEVHHRAVPTKLNIRSSTGGIGKGPFGEKAASISSLQLSDEEKKLVSAKQHTAVISFHYTGASWMELHEKGIKEIFKELNIALIGVADAHFNPELQNKQLNSFLSLEPDIFIAIPTDSKKTSKMFKKIAKSSSKLILITNVPEGLDPSDYSTVVSVNEHYHGRLTASGLGDNLRLMDKKNIGFIYHHSDFYATNQRDMAAKQILLEEYTDLSLVVEVPFTETNTVYNQTLELLREYPHIEGLYVSWDKPANEVLRALKEAKREDIIIGTADLDYSLAENIAKGGSVKSISAQQPYEQGRAIGLAAAKALLDKEIPSFIGIEPLKVTKKNLLQSWKTIFKEEPPQKLIETLLSSDSNME